MASKKKAIEPPKTCANICPKCEWSQIKIPHTLYTPASLLIRARMTRDMAIHEYAIWEILFDAWYYLEYGPLPSRCGGAVKRWWMKTYHEEP